MGMRHVARSAPLKLGMLHSKSNMLCILCNISVPFEFFFKEIKHAAPPPTPNYHNKESCLSHTRKETAGTLSTHRGTRQTPRMTECEAFLFTHEIIDNSGSILAGTQPGS